MLNSLYRDRKLTKPEEKIEFLYKAGLVEYAGIMVRTESNGIVIFTREGKRLDRIPEGKGNEFTTYLDSTGRPPDEVALSIVERFVPYQRVHEFSEKFRAVDSSASNGNGKGQIDALVQAAGNGNGGSTAVEETHHVK